MAGLDDVRGPSHTQVRKFVRENEMNDAPVCLPSLWDRLADAESAGTASRPWYDQKQTIAALQRDLGDLLNTHRADRGCFKEFRELRHSLLTYGLPDLTAMDAATTPQRQAIARTIEGVIRRHEPRLRSAAVEFLGPYGQRDRLANFRVTGVLDLPGAPDVAFLATLELPSGQYSVKADSE